MKVKQSATNMAQVLLMVMFNPATAVQLRVAHPI